MSLKSNGVVSLTREEALKRAAIARSDDGKYYGLGRGGRDPKGARPYDSKDRVDCSGAVCWFLGIDRLQTFSADITERQEFWWSTDEIYLDATTPWFQGSGWFSKLGPGETVLPGDLLVYPDFKVNGQTRQGHVAMVNKILPGFKRGHIGPKVYDHKTNEWKYPEAWYNFVLITHATPSHRTKYGNVIAETTAYAFRARKLADGRTIGGTFVRYTKWKTPSVTANAVAPSPSNTPVAEAKAEVTEVVEDYEEALKRDPLIVQLANYYQKTKGRKPTKIKTLFYDPPLQLRVVN